MASKYDELRKKYSDIYQQNNEKYTGGQTVASSVSQAAPSKYDKIRQTIATQGEDAITHSELNKLKTVGKAIGKGLLDTYKQAQENKPEQPVQPQYDPAQVRADVYEANKGTQNMIKEMAAAGAKIPEKNAYEKWYEKNIGGTWVDKALGGLQNADRAVSDFKAGALDTATLGAAQGLARVGIKAIPGGTDNLKPLLEDRLDNTAYKVGEYAGYIPPGAAIDRLVASAGKALGKNVIKNNVARALVRGGTAGAAEMALQEGGDVAFREGSFDPQNVALGAALGGGLGGTVAALAPVAKRFFTRIKTETPATNQPTLALPAPRERGNINTAETPDVVYGKGRVTNPEPLRLNSPEMTPPTTGRVETRGNQYRTKYENLINVARQLQGENQLPPGREYEYLNELWSHMASREDPGLDDLVRLAYDTPARREVSPDLISRAKETQRKRDVYGVPLPAKRVDERLVNQPGVKSGAAFESRAGRAPITQSSKYDSLRNQSESLPSASKPSEPIDVPFRAENASDDVEQVIQAVNQPRVRDRVVSYLDDAEKAARERIAKRKNRLSSNPIDEWADHAIIMAAKLGKGTIKAANFTEELVKEFGESIRPQAQRIYNQTKEVLRQQERRASKEGQDAAAFNAQDVGDSSSFRGKVSRNVKKDRTSFKQKVERIRTQFTDDLAALEGLEKRVNGRVASAEDSLYKAARLFKGSPSKANLIVQERFNPIVSAVEKSGHTMEDLGDYALAVHAKDVNDAGYKSGFTNKEIAETIAKYKDLESVRKDLVKISDDMLQELQDSGVVSPNVVDALRERWKNYMPLFRSFDDDAAAFEGGLSKALANVANPIKSLKGSERDVIDPIESMVKNIFKTVNAADRNRVAQQLAKLADNDPDANFIRRLEDDEKVGTKNVVTVKVNGDPVRYEVEPEVYKALLNLDQESSNFLMNMLAKPASLLRAGATLTPEFSLRNPMRDVSQAFVVSNSGFRPDDFLAGLASTLKKGDLYRDWIRNGGDFGNVLSMDRRVHREALEKVLKEPPSKKFVNIITGKKLIELLRMINDTAESATKVGEFRAALRKGVSPQEAAYRSRDLMDFARAGSSIRPANRVVAFMNANIQGKAKLYRAFKANPVGVGVRAFTAVTVPTIGIFLMQKYLASDAQKETIDNAPDWQKNSFWLVPIPGSDTVARIPKPFDLAPMFANGPERALDFAYNDDKEAFDGFARQTFADSAIPVQISGLLPIIEGMTNYSFFRGGSIIPEREKNLEAKDQYDPVRTTEVAKVLAAGADKLTGGKGAFKNFSSPRIVDNTIQGLTAGLGKYATDAVDSILQGKVPFAGKKVFPAIVDRPVAPANNLEQKPFLRSFLVDQNQGGKVMDKFYAEKERLTTKKNSAELHERDFAEADRLKQLEKTNKELNKINANIREIEASKDLTARQKRNQIDLLVEQRLDLIKQVMR